MPVVLPAMFFGIVEGLSSGVYIQGIDGRIVYWNHAAEEITGFLRQEVIGRSCGDNILVHCDGHQEGACCGGHCVMDEVRRDGKPRMRELYLRHKAGHRLAVFVRILPLRDDDGHLVGVAQVFNRRTRHPLRERSPWLGEAAFDPVTGLLTRDILCALARTLLAGQRKCAFGLMHIRVQSLHQFVEQRGAKAGETILKVVAETLHEQLHELDLLGRWEEDGFMLLLHEASDSSLHRVGERIRNVVAQAAIPWWGGYSSVNVKANGVLVHAGDTWESLLERLELPAQGAAPATETPTEGNGLAGAEPCS